LNASIDTFPLLLHLLRFSQSLEDGLLVELIEEHHLQRLLTLLHQEETNYLGNAIVEHLNHNVKVSIQTLLNLTNEESLWIVF